MILIKNLKAFKHNYNKIKNKNINIFYNINGKDLTDINKDNDNYIYVNGFNNFNNYKLFWWT